MSDTYPEKFIQDNNAVAPIIQLRFAIVTTCLRSSYEFIAQRTWNEVPWSFAEIVLMLNSIIRLHRAIKILISVETVYVGEKGKTFAFYAF